MCDSASQCVCVAVRRDVLQCVCLQCVAVCDRVCSALQYVAVCCSVLRCVVVCCSVLQCGEVCCSALQCVAVLHACVSHRNSCLIACTLCVCCSALQCVAVCVATGSCFAIVKLYVNTISITGCGNALTAHCKTLQHTATHCNTLQHTATHWHTQRHTATHCEAQVADTLARSDSALLSAATRDQVEAVSCMCVYVCVRVVCVCVRVCTLR